MRRLFVVLAKLIGLLQIYWGLTYLSSIALFIGQMPRTESCEFRPLAVQIGGIAAFALLSFGMAWALLTRTEWLADKLKIRADDPLPALSDDVVLRAGVKLVGVYILANAIPGLVKAIAEASAYGLWEGRLAAIWIRIAPSVLQVGLALFLAVRTGSLLRLLAMGEKTQGRKIIIGGVVTVAILLLLGRGLTIHPWLQNRGNHSFKPIRRPPPESCIVITGKDTNTPAARGWYARPYAGPVTNDVPDGTNSTVMEIDVRLPASP
ncbi:MAG: hypothetical protein FJ224_00925 [Lentisphaerae bacterium]|nr:hypothetical protein [Lentisphaerota bacterium]